MDSKVWRLAQAFRRIGFDRALERARQQLRRVDVSEDVELGVLQDMSQLEPTTDRHAVTEPVCQHCLGCSYSSSYQPPQGLHVVACPYCGQPAAGLAKD